jgi:hypothetical protein
MAFEFIKDLSEARVFRNPANLPSVGISNIAQNFFNAALALQIMRYENPKLAKKYAQQTLSNGLDGWRSSGSDFNNMAQILLNPERYSAKINIDTQITVPELQLKTWLRHIAKGTADEATDRRFFLALQRRLGVDSPGLISARRVVADWSQSLGNERTQATARVYRGLSRDLKQSDIFTPFARIASKQGATDNTKSGGIPLWAKLAAAGAGGYYLGKKIASW